MDNHPKESIDPKCRKTNLEISNPQNNAGYTNIFKDYDLLMRHYEAFDMDISRLIPKVKDDPLTNDELYTLIDWPKKLHLMRDQTEMLTSKL